MKLPDEAVRIMPLGGLDQFGMNACLLENRGELYLIDCGLTFPPPPGYGIDIIIPDFTYLSENIERVRAIIVTHGHEDHIGAIPFLLEHHDIPIYGSALALAMIKRKLEEHDVADVAYHEVQGRDQVHIGATRFEFIHMNHSIPQTLAVAIQTTAGNIIFTADWKIDFTPLGEETTDLHTLARLGEEGVLALCGDSTNSNVEGFSVSERVVNREITQIMNERSGRVIIAMFSSNVHRVRALLSAANHCGRRVVLMGRSLERNFELALECGAIAPPPTGTLIDASAIERNEDHELLILTTGSQAEPRSSLARLAYDDHNLLSLKSTDTVILSARVIPGNETAINTMIDALCRKGVEVITQRQRLVHTSGHAQREEMKLLLALTRPRYIVPIHGDFRMRVAHAALAKEVVKAFPLVINDGDILEFKAEAPPQVVGRIPAGRVAVDGKLMGDEDDVQIRDRKKLAATGVVVAFIVMNRFDGSISNGPSLMQHGFLADVEASEELMLEAEEFAREHILSLNDKVRTDLSEVAEAMRISVRRYFKRKLERKPVVIPIVHEL